jgi:hypothetical protein
MPLIHLFLAAPLTLSLPLYLSPSLPLPSISSLDVLDLIGRILNFTDAQKEAVGLKVPPLNILSSFLTNIVGLTKPPQEEIEVSERVDC